MAIIIPRYSESEVQTTGFGTPRATGVAPDLSGVAQSLGQVGDIGMEVFKQEKAKADSAAVSGRIAEAQNFSIDYLTNPETGLFNKKGKDAIGIEGKALGEFDRKMGDFQKTLTNDTQRRAFVQHTQEARNNFLLQVNRHERAETERYHVAEADSLIDSQLKELSLNYKDPMLFNKGIDQLKVWVNNSAKMKGMGPEEGKVFQDKALSAAYVDRIKQMMTDNPTAASTLFQEYEQFIEPHERESLKQSVSTFSDEKTGIDAAESLTPQLGTKSYTELRTQLYNQLKDRPHAFKIAEGQLRGDFEAAKADRVERVANMGGEIERKIAEAQAAGKIITPRVLANMPEYQSMVKEGSREAVHEATTFMREARTEQKELERERKEANREAKADAREAKAAHQQAKNEFMLEISDPSVLHAMSETQLREIGRKAGFKYSEINSVIKQKQSLMKSEKELQSAKVDHDILKDELFSAGYDYAYAPKTSEQKSTMGAVIDKVKQAMAAEQVRTGEKLTPDQQREIIRQQLLKVHVRQKSSFLGIGMRTSDEEVPQFQVEHAENYAIPGASSKEVATVVQVLRQRGISNPDYEMVQRGVKALKGK